MKYVKTECGTFILGWYSGCLYRSGGVLHTPKQPEQSKTLITTGGQTVAQHQTSTMLLIEVFLVKTTLSLQWPKSLLISLPAKGATGKGLLPFQDRLTTTFDQRSQ